MKYGITSEHNRLYIECLNGGTGSTGRRLVAITPDPVLRIADRLKARDHISFDIVYRGRRISESVYKSIQESDDYDASAVSILAESRLDVLTLTGFAKVLIERPHVSVQRRAA